MGGIQCELCGRDVAGAGVLVGLPNGNVVVYCEPCAINVIAQAMVLQEVQGTIDAMVAPVERN